MAPKDGRVLAGGQSLVPIMAFRLAKPAHLVDINGMAGLDKLASDGKMLSIGACVRHAAFHKPVTGNPLGQLLTLSRVISRTIRFACAGHSAEVSRTPIPASEWCLVAATLDATLVASSVRGNREYPGKYFFRRNYVNDTG